MLLSVDSSFFVFRGYENRCNVEFFEEDTQVFILRFWFEPREIEGAESEWRGVIEHVKSGERRYFQNLELIPSFVSKFFDGINKQTE